MIRASMGRVAELSRDCPEMRLSPRPAWWSRSRAIDIGKIAA
jgi:hypothetical protein